MGTVSRDLAGLFEFESLERAVVTLKCGAIFLLYWRVASKVTLNSITYRYKDLISPLVSVAPRSMWRDEFCPLSNGDTVLWGHYHFFANLSRS